MHPIGKIIIGVILVLAPIWYIWIEPLNKGPYNLGLDPKRDLATVVNGIVPILVILVGLFMIWLEMDELRIERELKAEERKASRKKK